MSSARLLSLFDIDQNEEVSASYPEIIDNEFASPAGVIEKIIPTVEFCFTESEHSSLPPMSIRSEETDPMN